MGNDEDSRSDKSDSNREDLVGQSMIKQKSVPLSLKTTNKHSSFQDNNLLVPSSIQENEIEETLRSASPNLIIRSNQSRIAEWRTQKNITLDEYNEFSEHCSDYNQVEVIEDYVESLNRAMSEKNVNPINNRKRSTFRKFYHSNFDEELSVSDEEGSLEIDEEEDEEILKQVNQRLTLKTKKDQIEGIKRKESNTNTQGVAHQKKVMSKRGEFSQKNILSSIPTSHVDIDTIGGKVSILILILYRQW